MGEFVVDSTVESENFENLLHGNDATRGEYNFSNKIYLLVMPKTESRK